LPEVATISSPQKDSTKPSAASEVMTQSGEKEKLQERLQPFSLQTKLTVGAPDDPYEKEADAVADKVMRMPETGFVQRKSEEEDKEILQKKPDEEKDEKVNLKRETGAGFIQRKCAACEKEEKEKIHRKPLSHTITPFIQAKSNTETPVSDSLASSIEKSRGNGAALDSGTQTFMQKRMGADFSNVKVHTGSESVQMNRELNAQAFTVGNNVYFNEGKFQPHNDEGKKLLAHELTHVVQQSNAPSAAVQNKAVRRKIAPGSQSLSGSAIIAASQSGVPVNNRISQKSLPVRQQNIIAHAGRGPPLPSIRSSNVFTVVKETGTVSNVPAGLLKPDRLKGGSGGMPVSEATTAKHLNSADAAATSTGSETHFAETKSASKTTAGNSLPGLEQDTNIQERNSKASGAANKTTPTENKAIASIPKPLAVNGKSAEDESGATSVQSPASKEKPGVKTDGQKTAEPEAAGAATEKAESAPVPPTAAKKKAAPEVELIMPEPPAELSPASQKRVKQSQQKAAAAATVQAALPDAKANKDAARGSVDEPKEEVNAKAGEQLVAALGERPAPSPEIVELCNKIREVIRSKRPPDEDELVHAEPEGAAKEAGGEVKQSVDGKVDEVGKNYDDLQQTPTGEKEKEPQEVVPPEENVYTPDIHADAATPDAVPPQNVSLDADVAATDQQINDAGMKSPTAQLVQTGPIAEARNAHAELGETAAQDPAAVEKAQQQILAKAGEDMTVLQNKALQALTASRAGTIKGVSSQQKDMKESEEEKRKRVGDEAQQKFLDTQKTVTSLLGGLSKGAMEKWDAGVGAASAKFKATLKKVEDWIDERHSGVGGFFVGAADYFTGLPDWVTEEYDKAEKQFGDDVCELITNISAEVNTIIASCEAMIDNTHKDITKLFQDAFGTLDEWANTELGKFDKKLQGLHNKVNDTKNQFDKELAGKAAKAVQDVREEIHALREKAKGLIGRIADAIAAFIDDPAKFIIEGLLSILGIPIPAFWRLVNKIKTVIGQIADDPVTFANNLMDSLGKGFDLFIDHFTTHLKEGFIAWITSGFSAVGVQLPPDFSVKSMITFFLQLMGISWERIRKLVAKQIGEENVEHIEKAFGLIAELVKKGPEGIIEFIKDVFNPDTLLSQIIDAVIDFVVKLLIERVAIELLKLFNPVGAILKAIEAIYGICKWIFENAAKIFTLVETIVNGVADIMSGNIGGMAKTVEKALTMLIAPIIDFLAELIGLGGLPDKVAGLIKGFQDWIEGILDKAITWLAKKAKSLLKKIGIGKDEEPVAEAGKPEDTEVGKVVHFTAGEEHHKLWVNTSGSLVTVMMASDKPAPLTDKVKEIEEKLTEENKEKGKKDIAAIHELDKAIVKDATDSKQKMQKAQAEGHSKDDNTSAKAADDVVEKEEDQAVPYIIGIIKLAGKPPIEPMKVNPAFSSTKTTGTMTVKSLYNDPKNHVPGTGTSQSDTLDGAMEDIETAGLSRYWSRGHLLNKDFGGLGVTSNLIPIDQSTNIKQQRADALIRTVYNKKEAPIYISFDIHRHSDDDKFVSSYNYKAQKMKPEAESWSESGGEQIANFNSGTMDKPGIGARLSIKSLNAKSTTKQYRAVGKANNISVSVLQDIVASGAVINNITDLMNFIANNKNYTAQKKTNELKRVDRADKAGMLDFT